MPLRPGHQTFLLRALLCAAIALGSCARVHAQAHLTGFSAPEHYPPPHQDRLRTLTTGDEATVQPNGIILLKGFQLRTFSETGDTNAELIVSAPECAYDRNQNTGSSPGPLQIDSGDGKFHIDGEGFLTQKLGANLTLDISNKVHTIIHRDFLSSGTNTAAQAPATTNSNAATQTIDIRSERFSYNRVANLITYMGNVRADDNQMNLTCDLMTVQRGKDGTIENIVGDRNVVITDKATGGRATGDEAVYTANPGRQTVQLTGNPRWEQCADEQNAVLLTGTIFIFDRSDPQHNILHSDGNAYLRLPHNSISQSGLSFGTPSAPATNSSSGTGGFVEIYSDSMAFQLPPTNGPIQSIISDGHVIILDAQRNSRATADHADYEDSTGVLQLTGHPVWQADQRLARGDLLLFNRTNQSFAAKTNAFLRFPAAALGSTLPLPADTNSPAGNPTNRFIEVLAGDYEYLGGLLTFHEQVHAAALEGDTIRGILDSGALRVLINTNHNQLETIEASQKVYGRLLPITNTAGASLERDIHCETLDIWMRTNGLVREIAADQNVHATQTEIKPGAAKPSTVMLDSEVLNVTFLPDTNRVEKITAERNVVITDRGSTARGGVAVYTAVNDLAQMTGQPVIVFTNGTLTGDPLIFDRRRNKFYAKNYTTVINVGTNRLGAAANSKPANK